MTLPVKLSAFLILSANIISAPSPSAPYEKKDADGLVHFMDEVQTPDEVMDALRQQPFFPYRSYRGDEETVIIEKIVNIAQSIWKVIEKNRPVVEIKYQYANALPQGVKSSEELEGFSDIQFRSYRMHGKNLYGFTVYDVTFTVIHRYNGSYKGQGRYLENATILPHKVDVLWGYTVNMGVEKVSAVNVGSKENPVASLLMEMSFRVSTVVKESQLRSVFQFRGDSPQSRMIE